jgi:transcriptional regulator with XRE-family HTH domain
VTIPEKNIAKLHLAICVRKLIDINKGLTGSSNVTSLRSLASTSGLEYSLVQKISTGKKDPQYTTLISLADGFGLTLVEFLKEVDAINEEDIKYYKPQSQKKKPRPSKKSSR